MLGCMFSLLFITCHLIIANGSLKQSVDGEIEVTTGQDVRRDACEADQQSPTLPLALWKYQLPLSCVNVFRGMLIKKRNIIPDSRFRPTCMSTWKVVGKDSTIELALRWTSYKVDPWHLPNPVFVGQQRTQVWTKFRSSGGRKLSRGFSKRIGSPAVVSPEFVCLNNNREPPTLVEKSSEENEPDSEPPALLDLSIETTMDQTKFMLPTETVGELGFREADQSNSDSEPPTLLDLVNTTHQ